MASNNIIYIPNQPVPFYKLSPTEDEQLLGMTAWDQTAYHKRLGNCGFLGPKYCQPYSINEADEITFQFKAKTTGDNLLTSYYTAIFDDANDTITPDFLEDTGATFQTSIPDAEVNMFVINETTPASARIVNVASETELELSADIFLNQPEDYLIFPIKAGIFWEWDYINGYFFKESTALSDITYESALVNGSWYKVTLTVRDITAGSIQVKLGTNSIATIDSIGEHVVYGQCSGSTNFVITASSSFVGEINDDIEVLELQTNYTIVYFDLEGNVITSDPHTETSDSLTIGNVTYVRNVASLELSCGNYVLGITDDTICEGEMMQNGDLEDSPNGVHWSFPDEDYVYLQLAIPPPTNKIYFDGAPVDAKCFNTLGCSIISGHSYTMTWVIGTIAAEKTGSYEIIIFPSTAVSPDYDVSIQSGTITLNFTAPSDSDFIGFQSTSEGTIFSLDNISLTEVTEFGFDEMDGKSECLCICDDQPCTVGIRFYSDRPTFGNFFTEDDPLDPAGNVQMFMRVQGRIRNLDPVDLELSSFKSTLEQQEQPYSNLQDAHEFATSHVPEWVHGSLRVALSHPTLIIGGVSFKRIGQYSPNWTDDSEMASGTCPVARTNQTALRNNY